MNQTSNVFYRGKKENHRVAVSSKGVFITDSQNRQYIDATGGPMVTNLGHGREDVARAAYEQILTCDYTHPTMFTSEPVEELARLLASHAPDGIERFYFLSGGAEAIETAVKLARQIHMANGRPGRCLLISRKDSYHGLSLGALAATGRESFRAPFLPMLPPSIHIPAPFCYRCHFGASYPQCGLECAQALETAIISAGPDRVSAFLMEPVSGAALAAVCPPNGYISRIREICDKYQVLLIFDEILCGLGRCGKWFACEHQGVAPDIMTMGKGIGAGAIALSAVGVQARHYDVVRQGSGDFIHGGTFSHHNVAAAVGRTVIRIMENENLVQTALENGRYLEEQLCKKILPLDPVGNIRGTGMLWGVEFVKDKQAGTPFPRSAHYVEAVWERLFENGVLAYKSSGFAGGDGDAIMIAPPFVVTQGQMDFIVDALASTLKDPALRA